ncbi:junction-mediating and -regulatory protein [Hemicordylus capensis]|uniref:junction-mediating and -regulatory protein n=1 Tax=Hemicordylus capensis TaxID=884348 RepID=UPI0023038880|nr:junction-mediating and -regulatory protein [Hemicordylus capensis]XP_053152536.1 junction-mediating and -regulatory protein [Hemicordylus capensis]
MSTFALEETLEADWVAVRPHAFHEREKHKFVFIVAWNEIEGKFAITCHNRTAQRQRSGSRELRRGCSSSSSSGSSPGGAEQRSSSASKAAAAAGSPTLRRSPAWSAAEPGQARSSPASPVRAEALLRSPGGRVAEASPRSPARARSSPARRPQPAPEAPPPPLSPAACAAEEIEVLELGKDEPAAGGGAVLLLPSPLAGPQAAEPPSVAAWETEPQSGEECSWAGLFSYQDLRAVHQQLCSVNSELEPCLPVFPEEPSGMWTVLFGAPELSEQEMEALCYQLQVYLGHCLDTCGWKILSQVLFTETDDPEEYYESLSELRQKGYEEVLQRARKRIQELLEKHKNTESMVELLELYQMEDEAYGGLAEATTELYQYLLQPFRDMRELAMLRRQQIKISIENDYLGPRRIESLQKEDADWQRKAHMAVLSIQDLTVKYFEITAKAQKAVYDRMRADQKKFGKAAWAAAVERMEKLQYAVSKETLQLMRAKEICLEQKKHALKEEMQSLQGGTEAIAHLDQLEADYYDLQLQLYEVQFEILKCEELLLTAQLESIKRLISEKRDEVVYYDTYESMEAMLEKEDMATSIHLQREELQKLQQKVRQLEARRGRISAKKAYLRNKKEICIAKHNEKLLQHLQSEEESSAHHTAKFNRERLQDEEERKSSWVSQERQKTLDRLRTFKQRYPGQVTLKSTRLRLAHARRKSIASSTTCADHSLSLPVTTQMDKRPQDIGPEKVIQPLPIREPRSLGQLEDTVLPPCDITSEFSQITPLPTSISNELHSDIISDAPLPPPLPPPPPPPLPPLLTKEESTQCSEKSRSPVKQDSMEKPALLVPSAHFFDSSQLVSAKKKLKKTGDIEGLQRRRVSSPMDEVLASLKRGSFHLRKVEQRNLPPFPDEDDSNNILAQIRKGVKLKKVQRDIMRESFTILPDDDPLTRSIHEALRRIKEASPESEDEEENLPCTDWEN